MKRIAVKLRKILRKVFILLGIVTLPHIVHAGYGMPDDGPRDTPVRGTVRSLKTGEPIAEIKIDVRGSTLRRSYYQTKTDDDGNFQILVPECERYDILFIDGDGELNGGFFRHETKTIMLSDIHNNLNVRLEGENDVTIRGVVRSIKTGETIPEIRLRVIITETNITYETWADNSGSFSIRVPERESYKISFVDARNDLFKTKTEEFALININDPLFVVLEEENIINIRGVVRYTNKEQPAAGITVGIRGAALSRDHMAITDDKGYFDIRIPEREEYLLNIYDPESNRYTSAWTKVTPSNSNDIIHFDIVK